MMSKVLRVVTALGFVSAVSIASTSASSSRADSASGDPRLAQVQVTDKAGVPLANAQIRVDAMAASAEAWGAHPWPVLGEGATDGTGHMQVALNAPDLNDPLIVRNQVYNIEVWLLVPSGPPIPILTQPRYLGTDPNRITEFVGVAAKTTQVQVSAPAAHQVRQDGALRPLSRVRDDTLCQSVWAKWQEADAPTVVGELHARYWAADAKFTYGAQSDSNIEVGLSTDNGPYSANGTLNVSNSASQVGTAEQQSQDWAHQIVLPFHYEQDRLETFCPAGSYYENTYQVYATQWDGGFGPVGADVSRYDGLSYQPNAVRMNPGDTYERNSKAAVTYSIGATAFGVGLSTQSGYSQWVTLHWQARFDSGGYGCLYGSHGDEPANVGIIYAGPYGSSGCQDNPTAAHVARASVSKRGSYLTFRWLLVNRGGIAGFNVDARSHQLNGWLIPVHNAHSYHFTARYRGAGPYVLQVVHRDGNTIPVPLR